MNKQDHRRYMAEEIWLGYFNQELHRLGLISDAERTKMALKIENRGPRTKEKSGRVH